VVGFGGRKKVQSGAARVGDGETTNWGVSGEGPVEGNEIQSTTKDLRKKKEQAKGLGTENGCEEAWFSIRGIEGGQWQGLSSE